MTAQSHWLNYENYVANTPYFNAWQSQHLGRLYIPKFNLFPSFFLSLFFFLPFFLSIQLILIMQCFCVISRGHQAAASLGIKCLKEKLLIEFKEDRQKWAHKHCYIRKSRWILIMMIYMDCHDHMACKTNFTLIAEFQDVPFPLREFNSLFNSLNSWI